MKRFLINITVVLSVSVVLLLGVTLSGVYRLHQTNFKFEDDTHILAYGPSTISYAIDDSILTGVKNFSRDAAAYNLLMPLLPTILDQNPQIDTVWISHGRFHFKHADGPFVKYGYQFIRTNIPLFLYDFKLAQWDYLLRERDFYGAMLNPDAENICFADWSMPESIGFNGYKPSDKEDLYNDKVPWGVNWYNDLMQKHGGNHYSTEWIMEHFAAMHQLLLYGIEACKERGVVPVLFFTPLYDYDRWFSAEDFREYMHTLDSDILIADYENFQFPDESYYRDVHHLNSKGAEYLSKHIAKHGLNLVRLSDWLRNGN